MPTKQWYLSKTIWFNALTGLLALLSALQTVVPPQWLPYIGLIAAVGNVFLRFISNQPLTQ